MEHVKISDAKETVLAFLEALNDEDFEGARLYATDDLTFEGVLGSRDGADSYFGDMKKMKLKYAVDKVFEDEDEVGVFYEIAMSGLNVFGAGWYKLKHGKIDSIRVVFDPRSVLALQDRH